MPRGLCSEFDGIFQRIQGKIVKYQHGNKTSKFTVAICMLSGLEISMNLQLILFVFFIQPPLYDTNTL